MKPQIGYFDIESYPHEALVWENYEANVVKMLRPTFMVCFSMKIGKKIETWSLWDFPLFKKDPKNDKALVDKLHQLMNGVDFIVAHNGDNFDNKYAMTRMIVHGLTPPAPFKSIDTYKIAKRVFRFPSNRLASIAGMLGIGEKVPHNGIDMWIESVAGNKKQQALMEKYNRMDVELLEGVHKALSPWDPKHPNLNWWSREERCPNCQSDDLQSRGVQRVLAGEKPRYQCQRCGKWSYGPITKLDKVLIS